MTELVLLGNPQRRFLKRTWCSHDFWSLLVTWVLPCTQVKWKFFQLRVPLQESLGAT